ncbi:MAG: thiol peroxidase [Desulfobulbaceae bacterium]|nr:thiol peroxidase [Desulfobulbaceae bacterium]
MAQITLQGNPIETVGSLPGMNTRAPEFTLTRTDLSDCRLSDFSGQTVVLNIFPSIDTSVCAASVRRFNAEASNYDNTVVLCVSADLPFAHQRFCEGEGLDRVIPLSVFRSPDFGKNYGVTIASGPIAGLLSRAIVIIDKEGRIVYTEQVPEIAQEPDYEAALQVLEK